MIPENITPLRTILLTLLAPLTFIVLPLVLAGCGGEDAFSGAQCPPADTATSISNLSVIGNVAPQSNLPLVKSNGESFEIDWDVETSCRYTFSVSISQDDVLDLDDEDVKLFGGTCAFDLNCREFADFDCDFTETDKGEIYISCNNGANVDVSSVLDISSADPVQQNVHVFLEVTNEAQTITATSSTVVIFEY